MATQSDLDKMRKKLSDLDAKLKSMRGNSAQRDPRFDARMADQNYANLMRDQQARLAAIDRRTDRITPNPEPKAPRQPRPSGPDFVDNRDPNKYSTMNMVNYYDPATGEVTSRTSGVVPGPGSRFVQYTGQLPQGPNGEDLRYIPGYVPPQQGGQRQPLPPEQAPFTPRPQFPQEVRDAIEGRNAAQNQFTQGRLMGAPSDQFGDIARRLEQSGQLPYQQPFNPNAPSLMPIRTPGSDAQNQQMATYNNLLQQGIQRSNTMNQDAATNFANLQAGAPTTQPAAPAKANPVVPIAGMGIQPKATPAPRKFSTVNTPSARFG